MKKYISILIASAFLIFPTELRELVKLPLLFQHYYEHKAENEELTFASYLASHYDADPCIDNDEERDNQLPFKSVGQNAGITSPAVAPSNGFIIKNIAIVALKCLPISHEEGIPHAFTGSIWQPPKSLI